MPLPRIFLIGLSLLALAAQHAEAQDLRVAVASNFRIAMTALAAEFEATHGWQVSVISGSTGKHFAQIRNGAPFDAFFAADSERPLKLDRMGLSVPGSRFSYALGRLVLWSPEAGVVNDRGTVLERAGFRHLAIANPKLAPYGRAAVETLDSLGLLDALEAKIVRGENVGQAFQFVSSGNAELGLLAWSQLSGDNRSPEGSWWLVPAELHSPIEQQAVLLIDSETGRDFMSFLRGERAAGLIRAHGYELPK